MSSVRPAVCLSVCPPVCLSVCDVGGSGPNRLGILETNTFILRRPKAIHLLPGEHGEILGRLEVGWNKWRAEHKSGNISETLKYREKVTMEDLQELINALSNSTVPDYLRPPLSQDWGSQPHPQLQLLVSKERVKLRTSKLAGTFTGSIRTKVIKNFTEKGA